MPEVSIGGRMVGDGHPVYIVAELGINHTGSIDRALYQIDLAQKAGADAIKFQKRTPELSVPKHMQDVIRETPWGPMTYMEYRKRVEFDEAEYTIIDAHCKAKGIQWFVSVWDEGAVAFMEQFDPIAYKIGSPSLTDKHLLETVAKTRRPTILSTGMSTNEQICGAQLLLKPEILCHCTSIYPCPPEKLNLQMVEYMGFQRIYPKVVGYSGHEEGTVTTVVAVALGAKFIERHFTNDRTQWGTDQKASLDAQSFAQMVTDIRTVEVALGDGVKVVYDEEREAMAKLRRVR